MGASMFIVRRVCVDVTTEKERLLVVIVFYNRWQDNCSWRIAHSAGQIQNHKESISVCVCVCVYVRARARARGYLDDASSKEC
jgi:hypothetical protein